MRSPRMKENDGKALIVLEVVEEGAFELKVTADGLKSTKKVFK